MFNLLIKNGVVTYEKIVSQYYDISGFTDNFLGDDNILNIIEIFKIENVNVVIPPMYQLVFALISTTYTDKR